MYEDEALKELRYMDYEYPDWKNFRELMIYNLKNSTKPMTIEESYHKSKGKNIWKKWISNLTQIQY
jgi:hypothetical protein